MIRRKAVMGIFEIIPVRALIIYIFLMNFVSARAVYRSGKTL